MDLRKLIKEELKKALREERGEPTGRRYAGQRLYRDDEGNEYFYYRGQLVNYKVEGEVLPTHQINRQLDDIRSSTPKLSPDEFKRLKKYHKMTGGFYGLDEEKHSLNEAAMSTVAGLVLGAAILARLASLPDEKLDNIMGGVQGGAQLAKNNVKKGFGTLFRMLPIIGPRLKRKDAQLAKQKAISQFQEDKQQAITNFISKGISESELLSVLLKDPDFVSALRPILQGKKNSTARFYNYIKKSIPDWSQNNKKFFELRKKLSTGDITPPEVEPDPLLKSSRKRYNPPFR